MRIPAKATALWLALLLPATAAAGPAVLYKNPDCPCCEGHAEYLRQNGIEVESVVSYDLARLRQERGVPADLVGCHQMLIGGYVVEGHVSVAIIARLLDERPAITGVSLPGRPDGAPGMTGAKSGPFTVYAFGGDAEPEDYAVE